MRKLPPTGATEREVSQAINDLIEGRNNATGTVTLAAGQTSTTVQSNTINANAAVFLFPMTANAAAAVPSTYATITPAGGSFTITHANNGQTDRTFYYVVTGG